jgi:GntR family transcriptional regulator
MQLHIQPGDEVPIYRQIMHQISDAIAGGRLRPHDRLPSQRELALELVISHLTVKKAYEELERAGLIHTQRGRGTFVCATAPAVDPAEGRERIREAARRLLTRAHLVGVPFPDLVRLLEELHEEKKS